MFSCEQEQFVPFALFVDFLLPKLAATLKAAPQKAPVISR